MVFKTHYYTKSKVIVSCAQFNFKIYFTKGERLLSEILFLTHSYDIALDDLYRPIHFFLLYLVIILIFILLYLVV